MKRILIILTLALFAGISAHSQTAVWGNPMIAVAMDADTVFWKTSVSENYNVGTQFYWYGNSDTVKFITFNSYAKKSTSAAAPADTLFVTYPGLDTIVSTATAGSITLDDPAGCAATWFGVKVISTEDAIMWQYFNFRRK